MRKTRTIKIADIDKKSYFGHVARRKTNNLERLIVTGKIEGERSSIGGPDIRGAGNAS